MRPLYVLIACAGIAASAHAQITRSHGGYLFRIRFTPTSVVRYKTVVNQVADAGKKAGLDVTFPIVQTVAGVNGDVADLVVKNGPLTINGQVVGVVNTYRMMVSTRGQLVGGQVGANAGVTVFPARPIRAGETWTATVPVAATAAMTGGASKVKATYRFLRIRTVDKQRVAELAVTFLSSGATKIEGDGRTYVLMSDGTIWRQFMTIGVALGRLAEPMNMAVTVTRY